MANCEQNSKQPVRTTYEELDRNPNLAVLMLMSALADRVFELHKSGESIEQECLKKLMYEWIYAQRAISRNVAEILLMLKPDVDALRQAMLLWWGTPTGQRPVAPRPAEVVPLLPRDADELQRARLLWWGGKRGRPITLRHAAIMALVRREYLNKPWLEVTRRICPCGRSHVGADDTLRTKAECQPKLQAEVRILKRLLRECKIKLPQSVQFGSDRLQHVSSALT